MKIKVLIIDDETMICKSLDAGLKDMGYETAAAQTSENALKKVHSFKPHIVLTDMKLGNENGIDLIEDIKKIDNEIEVIVMTAYSDIKSAVSAIKQGAFDYINKPFELEQIKLVLDKAYNNFKMKNKIYLLEKQNECITRDIIGDCHKMKEVFDKINKLSKNDHATVLIRGETGTGKELVAEAIHKNSIRKDSPLVRINCSAIPEQLVESELFGFEKSAFTGASSKKKGLFEIADGGTVFLDELGEFPMDLQPKLLRFLEERKLRRIGGLEDIEVDIRIIAATNKNLEEAVKNKEFREDLYYRINVIPIDLPPLRERENDILLIAQFFLEKFNKTFGKTIKGFDNAAKEKLLSYHWPGNIRELKNVVERIVILVDDEWIKLKSFPPEMQNYKAEKTIINIPKVVAKVDFNEISLEEKMDSIEKVYITQALDTTGWNQTKAAEVLGISRFTLKRKMEKYQLS